MYHLRIGVVGYCCGELFDEYLALYLLRKGIKVAIAAYPQTTSVEIASTILDMGIPRLAFAIAKQLGYETTGFGSFDSTLQPCLPVDHRYIHGYNQGDEAMYFLGYVHTIVRIGGGLGALSQAAAFRQHGRPVFEYGLEDLSIPGTSLLHPHERMCA